MPMPKLLRLFRSIAVTTTVIFVLHSSGMLSAVSVHTQKWVIRSGLLNAKPEVSEKTPFPFNFELQTLQGQHIPMDSLKGKVIFLNIWATWCGPCRAEMPGIESLYTSVKEKDIAFVMLAIDKKGDEGKIQKYLANKSFTFPVYRPIHNASNSFPEILRVPSIPTTFVIDRNGDVVYKKVGSANYDTKRFRSFLLNLLN